MHTIKRITNISGLLLALLFAAGGWAQAQNTGSVSGTITEKESGETLPGVNVVIKGTMLGSSTNIDGEYTIRNIRPGEYTLEITYVGFERTLITGVKVEAGETTTIDATIAPKVLTSDEEVVVIGEKPIFDVEKSNSSTTISRQQIEAAPVRRIQDVVSMEAGVIKDPTGLYIKGGRAYETGYVVDGVSAQDPLAGTGFGLDLGSNSFSNVNVITGGVGAEYGDVTSGVVSVKTRDGGENYSGDFTHKRDNFGSPSDSRGSNFFSDIYEFNLGGPSVLFEKALPALGIDLPGRLSFFASGQVSLSDEFYGHTANNVQTSLTDNDMWSPRQDNRWNGMYKLTYNIKPGMKLQAAYQRSLTVNQNTRMLQITGADVQISPGYQFFFQKDLDNANTYAHDSNLSYVKWTHTISETAFYELQASRLFTRLRADANGRAWRPDSVDSEFDAESIVTPPVDEFEGSGEFTYVLPGPGLANNGGIAGLWHDHFAEEITLQGSLTKYFNEKQNRLTAGFEFKFQDYQWIDITRPWVGAPIQIDEDTFSETNRLGESFDIWRVKPKRGAFYVSDQIRYRGLIANVGARMEYWAPGSFADNAVNNPDAPVPESIREDYKNSTQKLFGQRFKFRLLPKIRVSFPVRENQVLFFNYGHSTRLPHPRYLYAGLDPFYQDRSFLSNLGNPNLDPEVDISYEIGLRYQITANDALNISAYWRDKYDFVTTESIIIEDATGRETQRAFRVNGDYARVRGVEVTYIKRYSDWLMGQLATTYSRAEGLSSTNDEALQNIISGGQNVGNNVETPLAWDRPWDIKGSLTFTWDRENEPLFGLEPLNKMKLYLSAVWRSGIRYTPYEFKGFENNPISGESNWRPIYEPADDPADRYSETGSSWFYMDINFQRWFDLTDNMRMSFFLEITNVLNSDNPAIINPVTGEGYRSDYPESQEALRALRDNRAYDVPSNVRDPRYLDPRDNNTPAYLNPANYLQQRHIVFGASIKF